MVRILLTRRSSLVALALVGQSQGFAVNTQQQASSRLSVAAFQRTTTLFMSSSASDVAKKRVLVPIADGSEEIETTCITDTLTRFGADVTIASVMPNTLVCTMSRGIKVMADISIDDAAKNTDWDLIALPGGMPGAEHLRDSEALITLLEEQNKAGKMYGAVCAAPAVVLASKGLATEGATCYPAPAFRAALSNPVDDEVVVKDNLTTSQGPGTSLKFALMLGEQLYGKEKADEIAAQMLVTR
jgi:4-methyl-5(b-hydroxyethyl)-thiazole monophosphate biosynthesis